MKITRYKYYGQPDPGMVKEMDGEFVLYTDALSEVEKLRTALELACQGFYGHTTGYHHVSPKNMNAARAALAASKEVLP